MLGINAFRAVKGASVMRMSRQRRFAITGPSGSGKSSLVNALISPCTQSVAIYEPVPTNDIALSSALTSAQAMSFQEMISRTRLHQATNNPEARILYFDRTFEEDREVFLPLYSALGYLNADQSVQLRKLSIDCEASAGSLDAGIVLTARPEILRNRVLADPQQRPTWLLHNLELEFRLYERWIAESKHHFLVQDTSDLNVSAIAEIAKKYFDSAAWKVRS